MTMPPHIPIAALCLSLSLGACAARQARPADFSGPPQAHQLLSAVDEAETSSRPEKREDLYVSVRAGEPVPHVVAKNTVGPLTRNNARVRLYGDAAGTKGWAVDNFVLIEIAKPTGEMLQRLAIGFQEGVSIGSEQIDTVGQMRFQFAPGEIDLSRFLPEHDPFVLTVHALDAGGVGYTTDLFMIFSPDTSAASSPYELRGF